jgi:16S rRNA (guanine966-N2)-methyltransferase
VLDKNGLRPTPDRIRETLFNWLAMDVPGACVLDCFSGAGGLGLEAASREAKRVTLVDKDRQISVNLQRQCDRLGAENVHVVCADVLDFVRTGQARYDLVFIDPPYAEAQLRTGVLDELIDRKCLNSSAKIYLEWPKHQQMLLNHSELTWVKQKTAGKVCYGIAQWGVTG